MKINHGIFFNKHTTVIFIAMIILTAVIGTNLISDSFAMKAKGKPIWKYGSATSSIVCGDRLCSEISNEKNGYLSSIELQTQDKKTKINCGENEILIKESQCIPYEISGTVVTGAYVDEKLNSVIIEIDPYNGGTLAIEIPPQIISNMFMILIDGQEWRDSHIEGNTVTVNFPWATEKIEIIGEKI